jgi:hypothetical protein
MLGGVVKVVNCPCCGFEGEFKLLKIWRYRWWNVRFSECPRCNAHFASYVDPEGKRGSFVILYKPRVGVRR